jgi:hypothetical protein
MVQGLGSRVWGSEFGVEGFWFSVRGLQVRRVLGARFEVKGAGTGGGGVIANRSRECTSEFLSISNEHLSGLAPYGKDAQKRCS